MLVTTLLLAAALLAPHATSASRAIPQTGARLERQPWVCFIDRPRLLRRGKSSENIASNGSGGRSSSPSPPRPSASNVAGPSVMRGPAASPSRTLPRGRFYSVFGLPMLFLESFQSYTLSPRILGHGTSAMVLKGTDSNQRTVALKFFPKETAMPKLRGIRTSWAQNEANALQALPQHPNIVSLVDFVPAYRDLAGGQWDVLVQEMADRSDAFNYIQSLRLTNAIHELQWLLADAAMGLHAVHAHGMAHRDIKPENILITIRATPTGPQPIAKLADFAFAAMANDIVSDPRSTQRCGTPGYVAPEYGIGEDYGPYLPLATDVYALGVTFFSLLFGIYPPQERIPGWSYKKNQNLAPVDIRALSQQLEGHPPLQKLLVGMLQPVSTHRWTMDHVLQNSYIKDFIETNRERYALSQPQPQT